VEVCFFFDRVFVGELDGPAMENDWQMTSQAKNQQSRSELQVRTLRCS